MGIGRIIGWLKKGRGDGGMRGAWCGGEKKVCGYADDGGDGR